ncbi:hypothetical protein [Flavihumibacter fluvii]|uniref:hypothetical protein n=1 Tax=Flavihumibacter fluvii TaxID=2838157 RepID=UPI001BDEF2C7|nr:hypothetical protein [Flavihumibacter fluvii]ULQ54297.1 hypothetical protein KJS93_08200 [Flavihumibacter fluvii]
MKQISIFLGLTFLLLACNQQPPKPAPPDINQLAEKYVRLALDIGRYDSSFVDAYYGPDSLKATGSKKDRFPKDSFLAEVQQLQVALSEVILASKNDTILLRSNWMKAQLTAFGRRIKIFSGEYEDFDVESLDLFGVAAPVYPESHYQGLVAQLDGILPGSGAINERFQSMANRFIIPKAKLDTVFHAAIAECRKQTAAHYAIPANENFALEFVTNKPWNGYNWYKGNYQSLIQINTDLQIFIDRAIDVGSHESYPGHHVYNMLLEKNLYHDKGWVEISLYPLFSPQSLIAEGSANYGIDLVFPGIDSKVAFCKNVLLPLAGLDTTGVSTYFKALAIKGQLNFARNEVGRGMLNNTMDSATSLRWLKDYCLMNDETAKKSIQFITVNRSYVINYNYGMQLIKNYIDAKGGGEVNPEKSWDIFKDLLSNPVLPTDLLITGK